MGEVAAADGVLRVTHADGVASFGLAGAAERCAVEAARYRTPNVSVAQVLW